MIPIQSSITGYGGQPCTLYSAYNQESKVLVVSVEAGYRTERRDGCTIIANDPQIDRDKLFTEEDLQDAIVAFFMLQGGVAGDNVSPRLVFDDKAARSNPAHAIEKDGIDASGQRFRINANITSAQVAALATCWHVSKKLDVIDNVLTMADRLIGLSGIDDLEYQDEMSLRIAQLDKYGVISI